MSTYGKVKVCFCLNMVNILNAKIYVLNGIHINLHISVNSHIFPRKVSTLSVDYQFNRVPGPCSVVTFGKRCGTLQVEMS